MNWLDRAIASVSPRAGLRRATARGALQALAHYNAASVSRRSSGVRAVSGDADAVAQGVRRRIMLSVRDVVRNNPTAKRAVQVLVNNIIGTGIEPKLVSDDERLKEAWKSRAAELDSVAFDVLGASTLAGIQRLAVETMVTDGEALILWPDDARSGGQCQVRVLESEYLNDSLQGRADIDGHVVYDGIEYDQAGRVVAYYLYDEHPDSAVWLGPLRGVEYTRVDASRVIHLYRMDRPDQRRGVSWFAPVLDDLVALADNDEAQLMRQKIAACFAAFWRSEKAPENAGVPKTLSPGLIQQIGADDEVTFASPPDVTGYDDFARIHLRRIAAGLGITYEALTGDLSNVNYSSARIGRIEMSQGVESIQWTLVMPRLCAPLAKWILQGWAHAEPALVSALCLARLDWTPPPPVIADPKTETQVSVQRIEAGLSSRHGEIRRMGYEPGAIDAEITADTEMRRSLTELKSAPKAGPTVEQAAETLIEERNLDAA
ncbi:phage portal protein [Oceaniovalibus sp. ACAM 378]|uniref:phage portal protein n=1 Tax=Oceaniovalibus sp. ACAM 378 TaxID=2599923 RepID=UPI0011D85B8E|nr:phage portal protein [Oceaniovalibus sp. ACAM 378]TYB83946.1 phage portal protein [Oceaniovalibus sp. ACAM 378]